MNEQHVTLDVGGDRQPTQVVRIGQGDVHGTTIVASIRDGPLPLDLDGAGVSMVAVRDGAERSLECTVDGSDATCVLGEDELGREEGPIDMVRIRVSLGGTVRHSTGFLIDVLAGDAGED